jgi:hypothetical protein
MVARVQLPESGEFVRRNRPGAVSGSLEGEVVEDDRLAVTGGLNVEFKDVRMPPAECALEGEKGVLGCEC